MNAPLEKQIIKAFFCQNRADRIVHELASVKKRRACIWGFESGQFDSARVSKVSVSALSAVEIAAELRKHEAPEKCFVLSIDESIDGKEMNLSEAVSSVFCNGPALISCIHGKLAYFEGENEGGKTERYLLVR